jgi:hypothetical protein
MSTKLNNIHMAYYGWLMADQAWSEALIMMYGKDSGEARYDHRGTSSNLLTALHKDFMEAGDLWHRLVCEAK